MRICIFTNTFLPHVGGVARSVSTFLQDYRRAGHRVLVVAPEFDGGRVPLAIERSVTRVPAWKGFNGTEFSVSLPLGPGTMERVRGFRPEIVHAQHPFLLGDSALRVAAQQNCPVFFTHHTLYEQYLHYVGLESDAAQTFVIELVTRFANCCDGIIAPSASVADLLASRGVTSPVRVIPTGIDTRAFADAARGPWRKRFGIPADAVVIGHVGRFAPEKNLEFLAEAIAQCLAREARAVALLVGGGPSQAEMEATFARRGVRERVHFTGKLTGRPLREAYAAMDLFAFASLSETQGMVLIEAMAAGVPVVALDASGVRDVVRDRRNGRLLDAAASPAVLGRALVAAVRRPALRREWRRRARETARVHDRRVVARQALTFYRDVLAARGPRRRRDDWEHWWQQLRDRVAIEGRLFGDKIVAITHALSRGASEPPAATAAD